MLTEQERARAFQAGLTLFNQGDYFTAHEAWEKVWREAHGAERQLVQGLIQVAAALLHVERGNLRGARALYGKAAAKLAPLPSPARGLALAAFRCAVRDFFALALAGGDPPPPPPLLRWAAGDPGSAG